MTHLTELAKARVEEAKETGELNLSGGLKKYIPWSIICSLVGLVYLYLDGEGITSVPAEICQLQKLEHLDLADNKIEVLPAEIGELSNLKRLLLHTNKLKELPANIGQLESLTRIDLWNNKLTTLPIEMGNMGLEMVDVTSNSISEDHDVIKKLRKMKTPYLRV